jgi:hypothetical protein
MIAEDALHKHQHKLKNKPVQWAECSERNKAFTSLTSFVTLLFPKRMGDCADKVDILMFRWKYNLDWHCP